MYKNSIKKLLKKDLSLISTLIKVAVDILKLKGSNLFRCNRILNSETMADNVLSGIENLSNNRFGKKL